MFFTGIRVNLQSSLVLKRLWRSVFVSKMNNLRLNSGQRRLITWDLSLGCSALENKDIFWGMFQLPLLALIIVVIISIVIIIIVHISFVVVVVY